MHTYKLRVLRITSLQLLQHSDAGPIVFAKWHQGFKKETAHLKLRLKYSIDMQNTKTMRSIASGECVRNRNRKQFAFIQNICEYIIMSYLIIRYFFSVIHMTIYGTCGRLTLWHKYIRTTRNFSGSPVGMMEWASYPRKGHLSVYDIQTICVDNGIFPETSAGECNENLTLFRN